MTARHMRVEKEEWGYLAALVVALAILAATFAYCAADADEAPRSRWVPGHYEGTTWVGGHSEGERPAYD